MTGGKWSTWWQCNRQAKVGATDARTQAARTTLLGGVAVVGGKVRTFVLMCLRSYHTPAHLACMHSKVAVAYTFYDQEGAIVSMYNGTTTEVGRDVSQTCLLPYLPQPSHKSLITSSTLTNITVDRMDL